VGFKGVFQIADVWVNGKLAGRHVGGFTGFQFDVTDLLKWNVPNLLAVRVDDVLNPAIARGDGPAPRASKRDVGHDGGGRRRSRSESAHMD
jgi:hypothetical protein